MTTIIEQKGTLYIYCLYFCFEVHFSRKVLVTIVIAWEEMEMKNNSDDYKLISRYAIQPTV